MLESSQNYLYKLAWQYDPNALIAVNPQLQIELVNPTFCSLFNVNDCHSTGEFAESILGNVEDLEKAWTDKIKIENEVKEYEKVGIFVKEFIFPLVEQDLILCIMMDLTEEVKRKKELNQMKEEMLAKVSNVVDNQMKVAQEIAGLLGETTAETKVNLFKLIQLFND